MRKKIALLVTLCVLAGGGCALRKSAGQKSAEELSKFLLTVTDMPKGWEETQRQVFDERSNENPSIDPSVWCADAATESKDLVALSGDAGADVEMNWTGGSGPRMMRLQAWSNKDVRQYMDMVKASVEACDGVSATDDIGVLTETKKITGRDVWDDSVSWSDRTVPPAGTWKDKFESIGRTTVARRGEVIMVMQLGDSAPAGTARLMPEDEWWGIVERAAKKLEKASR